MPGAIAPRRAHGTAGRIVAPDETGSTSIKAFASQSAGAVFEKAGSDRGWIVAVPDETVAYGFHAQLAHFVETFAAGRSPRQNFIDAVIDNAIVDAGYRSMAARAWVDVDYPAVLAAARQELM